VWDWVLRRGGVFVLLYVWSLGISRVEFVDLRWAFTVREARVYWA
jgi:hypothetical protein